MTILFALGLPVMLLLHLLLPYRGAQAVRQLIRTGRHAAS